MTATAVLPANRPAFSSKLPEHSSNSELRTRTLVSVGERSDDNFQVHHFTEREIWSTRRGHILYQFRAAVERHVVRHELQIFFQGALRSSGHGPSEPQPSGKGQFPAALA